MIGLFSTLGLVKKLLDYEKMIAVGGYRGIHVLNHDGSDNYYTRVRARHEVINRRIKSFNALGGVFRHGTHLHGSCFHAACQLIQISFKTEHNLFEA